MFTITHRTRRLMGAGLLALGMLGAQTAHAQTTVAAGRPYQARIPGAQVAFYRADLLRNGTTAYMYTVLFADTAGLYMVQTGFATIAAAHQGNALMLRATRGAFAAARSTHRAGVWVVQGRAAGGCSVAAGTSWRRFSFLVSATAPQCAAATRDAATEFAAVGALLGRHSTAAIPWLAAAPARPRGASVLVVPTVAPPPVPTATSVPQPQPAYLAQMSADQNDESATFVASGSFTINWSADLENQDVGIGFFGLSLYSASDNMPVDEIASATASDSGSYLVHADCSGGCYLKVYASNMSYTVTAQ